MEISFGQHERQEFARDLPTLKLIGGSEMPNFIVDLGNAGAGRDDVLFNGRFISKQTCHTSTQLYIIA